MKSTCDVCKEPKTIRCPCDNCDVVTHVPFCPVCEPKKLNGFERMVGIKVCEAHVAKHLVRDQLAATLRPIRAEHDQKHTSIETMSDDCPFCRGDIT